MASKVSSASFLFAISQAMSTYQDGICGWAPFAHDVAWECRAADEVVPSRDLAGIGKVIPPAILVKKVRFPGLVGSVVAELADFEPQVQAVCLVASGAVIMYVYHDWFVVLAS
jgi:hypothetical protein